MRLRIIIGFALIGVLLLAGCSQKIVQNLPIKEITVFKSPSCGCCKVYSQYMKGEGFQVNVKEITSMDSIRSDFGVPASMQSCHTSQIGNYFVEGHVPLEAVEKLLLEMPDIAGISIPGMPSGSPGMPGLKSGLWTVYAINHDGSITDFMKI